MGNIPTWVIAVTAVFITFVITGVLIIAFRDPPVAARPEAVEARFAEQIQILENLAMAHPGAFVVPELEADRKSQAFTDQVTRLTDWSQELDRVKDQFNDPAILSASVLAFPGDNSVVRVEFINEQESDDSAESWIDELLNSLGRDLGEPEVGRPVVRHWIQGARHLVRYESRFLTESGEERGCRLIFDMNLLEGEKPALETLPEETQLDGSR